jgi:hypothetical protein
MMIAALAFAATFAAGAAASTFRIASVFSNLDGSMQFVVLTETQGLDGQQGLAGLKLTVTRGGVTREFTFDHDLPSPHTAYTSIVVGTELLVDDGYLGVCCGHPDYLVAQRFFFAEGGTIDFAGVDRFDYGSLPNDGLQALMRDGTVGRAWVPPSVCHSALLNCTAGGYIGPSTVRAVEYYNATLDRYFLSAFAQDLDALDSGRTPGWQRTGIDFAVGEASLVVINWNVWDYPLPDPFPMVPVCRFYMPPGSGNTHFYTASAKECDAIHVFYPDLVFETSAAFYVALPDFSAGECPKGPGFLLAPMYRLVRQGGEHRFTLDRALRDAWIADGYMPEGVGADGIAFCVPMGI